MTNPEFTYEDPPPVNFETEDAKFSLVHGSLVIELKRDVRHPAKPDN